MPFVFVSPECGKRDEFEVSEIAMRAASILINNALNEEGDEDDDAKPKIAEPTTIDLPGSMHQPALFVEWAGLLAAEPFPEVLEKPVTDVFADMCPACPRILAFVERVHADKLALKELLFLADFLGALKLYDILCARIAHGSLVVAKAAGCDTIQQKTDAIVKEYERGFAAPPASAREKLHKVLRV